MTTEIQKKILSGLVQKIRPQFERDCTGHDWHHIERVATMAEHIHKVENKGNLFIIKAAAYLHDISDHKFNGGDFNAGAGVARGLLKELQCPEEDIAKITYIIDRVSFKGALVRDEMETIEGQIVQDADRLDAIGAIGITRTFAFGGNRDREIYNPSVPPLLADSPAAYANAKSHTVNHFYEKLFLLRDRLNTDEGRRIGNERHTFMMNFLKEFYREWDINGNAAPAELAQFDN